MPGKAILNYTTNVPVRQTMGECQEILMHAGADTVAVTMANREPTGLSFRVDTPFGLRSYALPVNVDGVYAALHNAHANGQITGTSRGRSAQSLTTRKHAQMVAWRIAKDWLESQMAIIEAGMAQLPQIMMPYELVGPGKTMWEEVQERRALSAGRS
jgi:hypothetical protein